MNSKGLVFPKLLMLWSNLAHSLSSYLAGRDKVPSYPGGQKPRLRGSQEMKAEHFIQLFGVFFCKVLFCGHSDRAKGGEALPARDDG